VTAIAGFLGLLLVIVPNFAPATTRDLTISDVSVEQNVSWHAYVSRRPVIRATASDPNAGYCPEQSASQQATLPAPSPGTLGVVVDLAWTAQGMRGRCLELAASLLDANTGSVITELPIQAIVQADTQISDSATYLIWVDVGGYRAGQAVYLVRVEFFDGTKSNGVRLAYKDTAEFCFPTICPSAPATPSHG
jgi:hypothetical protein